MSITKREFGKLESGEAVSVYQIKNESGAYIEVTDYGAILRCICVPDKDGKLQDVVLGYDKLEQYFVNGCYFGSTIGRNGNRIAGGKVPVNGQVYQMPQNENENNLHSGPDGYEKQLWKVKEVSEEENAVTFTRMSPDKEQGLPGNFEVAVTYQFTGDNEVKIHYQGVSDQDTLVNMTNHSYFNLSGHQSGTVADQYLCMRSEEFTPVIDSKSIPTGEYAKVADTPMDFRTEKKIGQDVDADYEQLKMTGGYDHNFMLMDYQPGKVRSVAKAYAPDTEIVMEVLTDTPAVQFYSGNFVEREEGKNNAVYTKRSGFCLETQFEPDAVNQKNFHSPILKAGEKYDSTTIYRFSVKKD